MKRLKQRLRKLHKRLNRSQAARHRLIRLRKWAKKNGVGALAASLERLIGRQRKRNRELHGEIRQVERKIEKAKEEQGGSREKFVNWVRGEVGVIEGSKRHLEYIAIVGKGGSSSWPWCSEFAAAGLVEAGGFDRDEMPANPWYSGAWLTWSNGHRVPYSEAIAGDLIIYDWGDGGMTDHVEVYVGSGQGIGGNESHPSGGAVNGPKPVSVGNVVGVVRPHW